VKLRPRLTYANVIATVALFLVLGGGAAFAATQLPKNSVGSKQLKKHAVTSAKLAKSTLKQLQGATGPAGAVGPKGDTGATGKDAGPAYSTVYAGGTGLQFPLGEESTLDALALKNLPAGSYAVSFTGSLFSLSEEPFTVFCGVEPEGVEPTQGGEGFGITSLPGGTGPDPEATTVAVQTVVTFASDGGELVSGCGLIHGEVEEEVGDPPFTTNLTMIEPQLTAVKVASASIDEVGGPAPSGAAAATLRRLGLSR
jgi:hypothetical protein